MVSVSTNTVDNTAPLPSRPRCVHTITDRFSMNNTYLIDDTRLVVVDPVSALNGRLLSIYLQTFLHRSLADIDLIVLTDLQQDASSGIQFLRHNCAAPIAASAHALMQNQPQVQNGMAKQIYNTTGQGTTALSAQQAKHVDIWLQDVAGLPFHPDWRIIGNTGHTPDSICLYNPFTGELLSGDTLTTMDNGAPLLRRGIHRVGLNETLRVLQSLPVHYLYPGHGRQIVGKKPLVNVRIEW